MGFSTMPKAKKLTPRDCDDDRQPEIAIWTFRSPILQFPAVGRCRNHLASLLSSSTSSKIPNLALEFRRYLSEYQRCNYFRFWGHINISGCRSLLYLLVNIILKLQADTSLRSVSSCPCLLSPLRGSVSVLAHAGPCCARHTLSGLLTPHPCVHSCKPRQRYRRTELFCNIRYIVLYPRFIVGILSAPFIA